MPRVKQAIVLMLLSNTYDPDPRVRQEALTLLELGYRVRLLAWDRDCKDPVVQNMEGVEVERVRLASRHGRGSIQLVFYGLLYLKMLWRAATTSFDVVHCHDLDTLPLGFAVAKLKRRPVVYDSHESFVDMLEGSIHPSIRRVLLSLETFMIRRVNLLITVGEKLRRVFERRGARRSVVVGNWKTLASYERTPEQNADFRRKLGIPEDALVVTCISQLLKNRMIQELVEAAQLFPNVYVVIAGKGELEASVRKWAAENPRVVYPGFLHASEVPAYTCASDVIFCGFDHVNPNAQYAAPNKLYEALAAGKPLISPDVGEIGDLIRRESCGVVTPDCSARAICAAIEQMRDPEKRDEWTRNARRLGQTEMNWDKGRRVLFEEYSLLCPQPPAHANRFISATAARTGDKNL